MIERDNKIGISDISVYIPSPSLQLETLVERRIRSNPRLDRHMERARRVTGQQVIRFPEIWEDTATLASAAAYPLLGERADPHSVRHLAVGTETGLDHSKPVSAYVQGMLQGAGVTLPSSMSSFQVQHACAGGTMALLGVAGMIVATGRPGDTGLVISSDIARYETESTAEITQGAGAVALTVEERPRLVELDLATVGYYSSDVDDFFRPLGSTTARVNGSYSMRCYSESLEAAFLDHCGRAGENPERLLSSTDYLVLHTPFRNMPEAALEKLFEKVLGYDAERTRAALAEKSFAAGTDPLARIGNLYAGSLTASLAFLLDDRWRALGQGIVGKSILLASYGSGNTMIVLRARIAPEAPAVIARWDLDRVFRSARPASFEEYEAWTAGPVQPELYARLMENAPIPQGAFALTGIRKDGYREYTFAPVGPGRRQVRRKEKHLTICTDQSRFQVEGAGAGFDGVRFLHEAMPELAVADIDPSTQFLGTRVSLPFLISCMTGGSDSGFKANKLLARAAQELGIPVGLGSVRVLLENPDLADHFRLKSLAPDVPVLANISAVQVRDGDASRLLSLVERLEAQALVVHLNPGQELFQPEGDRDFRGLKAALSRLVESTRLPIIVKETGFGIRPRLVRDLLGAGIAYVDIAGAGGTNWITVESYRAPETDRPLAAEFSGWGIPTAQLLAGLGAARRSVIASGGLRSGLDAAKALAMGAELAGFALPVIRAVVEGGAEAVVAFFRHREKTLRTAMLLTGSRTLTDLRRGVLWEEPGFTASVGNLRRAEGMGGADV